MMLAACNGCDTCIVLFCRLSADPVFSLPQVRRDEEENARRAAEQEAQALEMERRLQEAEARQRQQEEEQVGALVDVCPHIQSLLS